MSHNEGCIYSMRKPCFHTLVLDALTFAVYALGIMERERKDGNDWAGILAECAAAKQHIEALTGEDVDHFSLLSLPQPIASSTMKAMSLYDGKLQHDQELLHVLASEVTIVVRDISLPIMSPGGDA